MSVRRFFEGLTLVVLGGILLLYVTDAISGGIGSFFSNLLRLWPLLLVSIGLDILGKGLDNTLLRALGSLVIIGGLLVAAFVMPADGAWWPFGFRFGDGEGAGREFSRVAAADTAVSTGSARVDGGVGVLTVRGGPDMARIEGRSPFGEPRFDVDVENQVADVRIDPGDERVIFGPDTRGHRMDVQLSGAMEWDLDIRSGVSKVDAELSAMRIRELRVEAGVSDTMVRLGPPEYRETPVDIKGGVSSFKLRLPRGSEVRIRVDRGLSGVDVPEDLERDRDGDRDVYTTPGYDSAALSYDILIKGGISGIDVSWY